MTVSSSRLSFRACGSGWLGVKHCERKGEGHEDLRQPDAALEEENGTLVETAIRVEDTEGADDCPDPNQKYDYYHPKH